MISNPRQSGAALALVLLVLAVAMTMGMSYLASTSISLAASQGFEDAARARYLAESGIQHAICLLRENPDMLIAAVGTPLGPFYVDDTTTGYSFALAPTGAPGCFTVTSWADSGRSTQTASAAVFHSGGVYEPIGCAMMTGSWPGWVSSTVKVKGRVHGNGNIIIRGVVDGDVSAVGMVANSGSVSGTVEANADVISFPSFTQADYEHYLCGDLQGEAITTTNHLIHEHNAIDDGRPVTDANPAGVVIVRPAYGSLWLRENLNFRGTLVVYGDLVLDGWNMDLSATSGFPVLIVTGRIFITCYAAGVKIQGVVYAADGVWDLSSTIGSKTEIRGSFVSMRNGYYLNLKGTHAIEYDAALTTLLHPQGWGCGGAVDVLSWDR